MHIHEDTKLSEIRARRARPGMVMVRQHPNDRQSWKTTLTDETDTVWGMFKLPRDKAHTEDKEYPVLLFTDRFPEGLHFGPGEKIQVVRDA
jgi:hypothetical protein